MTLVRRITSLALPAVAENLFNSLIFLVDALMVASLGPASLAAQGIAAVLFWRLKFLGGVLQIGLGASVARRWGGGAHGDAATLHAHGAVLGFLMGAAVLPLWLFAEPVFRLLNAQGQVLELVIPYFQVVVLVWPMRLASLHMAASFRAAGDTKTPLLTTAIMNAINVVFNYIFIFGVGPIPALGLFGAGLGTCIAVISEFLLLAAISYRGVRMEVLQTGTATERQFARYGFVRSGFAWVLPGSTRSILRISWPSFWEEVAISVGFLGFIAMIARLGQEALAAHTATLRVESFSFNIGWGIAIAAATLVGQFLGAHHSAFARRTFGMCLVMAWAGMGAVGIILALGPDWFLGWFIDPANEDLMDVARLIFLITALEQPVIGTSIVLAQGLRGAGYTKAPFYSQLVGVVALRIGVGYYLCFTLDWGLVGIYWATLMDWSARTVILGWIAWKGKWQETEV